MTKPFSIEKPLQMPYEPGTLKKLSGKDKDQEIHKAATEFEGLLLQQMFQSMWKTVPQGSIAGGGQEEEWYRDMMTEQLSKSMAENQSLGIKDAIEKDMRKIDGKK